MIKRYLISFWHGTDLRDTFDIRTYSEKEAMAAIPGSWSGEDWCSDPGFWIKIERIADDAPAFKGNLRAAGG